MILVEIEFTICFKPFHYKLHLEFAAWQCEETIHKSWGATINAIPDICFPKGSGIRLIKETWSCEGGEVPMLIDAVIELAVRFNLTIHFDTSSTSSLNSYMM